MDPSCHDAGKLSEVAVHANACGGIKLILSVALYVSMRIVYVSKQIVNLRIKRLIE